MDVLTRGQGDGTFTGREYRVEATRGKLKLGFVACAIPRGSTLEDVSKPGGR